MWPGRAWACFKSSSARKRISFSLGGGLALVGVQSTFGYDEQVSIASLGTEGHQASSSDGDVLVGYYVSGSLSVALCSRVSLFASGQYQDVGTYTQTVNNVGTLTGILDQKSAKLDMNNTVFFTVGLSYSF